MSRIKNDPSSYVTRSQSLPTFDRGGSTCAARASARELDYFRAPINGAFYIDYRGIDVVEHKPPPRGRSPKK